jgi:shikimate dehydrogenase
LGLDFAYLAFDVAPEQLKVAVGSIRALGLRGVNVTIPHKVAVMAYLDELSEEARLIGAVNTIVNENGRLIGYNTDGIGYLTALRNEANFDVAGKQVLLLGAGGAARAVAGQMALHGAAHVTIAARDVSKAQELADHLASFAKTSACSIREAETLENGYALIVNTTPVGMHPHVEQVPFDTSCLQAGQLVSDLIYNPRETRFLQEATARGCRTHGGLGMFIHQGAHAFHLWTGMEAPVDVMRETVESYL